MKSHLGRILATTAAAGCAAFLVIAANAQNDDAAPRQPPVSDARTAPPPDARDVGSDQRRRGAGPRFSVEDRAAFFDAHIAAIKAGLELTPDQERLWGPIEQAVRDLAKTMVAQRQKIAEEAQPRDPIARLRNQGDAAVARGQALQKLADAAQPLWATLSGDQKRRLPILMHGMRGGRGMQPRNSMQEPRNGWRERMRRDDDANQRPRD